jgi:cation diffusion facilitator family transporter
MNGALEAHDGSRARRLVIAALIINSFLLAASVFVYVGTRSQLVLAQGSDSLIDLIAGAVLVVGLIVASRPRDETHPFGHHRAESIGALITAVLAGVLCIEVVHSAVGALLAGETARVDVYVAAVLGGKLIAKLGLLAALARTGSRPAIEAARVDTRNDVAGTAASLLGYGLARAGLWWADAAFALPVALYVGYNGFELARANLRYLMGEAPDRAVIEELRALAAAVPGVLAVSSVRAHFVGHLLHTEVSVVVDVESSATRGHDISVEVQQRVQSHELVGECFVHVDTVAARDHD